LSSPIFFLSFPAASVLYALSLHDALPISGLPGGYSEREPPDPIPNSEVKTLSADGSVGPPHARVGHRQALDSRRPRPSRARPFFVSGPAPGHVVFRTPAGWFRAPSAYVIMRTIII